jgi:hypothetical protein
MDGMVDFPLLGSLTIFLSVVKVQGSGKKTTSRNDRFDMLAKAIHQLLDEVNPNHSKVKTLNIKMKKPQFANLEKLLGQTDPHIPAWLSEAEHGETYDLGNSAEPSQ